MNVLVTGGAGYCGVRLCENLLASGNNVTVVDNFMFGYDSLLHIVAHPKIDVIAQDIRYLDVSHLKRQDVVFHLAAISGHAASEIDREAARSINVDATARIIRMLDPQQLLIFPSTTSFYGSSGMVNDEASLPSPISLYGKTKWEAERLVMERPNSVGLRLATIFGLSSRMRSELLVNDFVESAINRSAIVLYNANAGRTFMHIDDLLRGYQFVLDKVDRMVGSVFNMGTAQLNLTKRQVAERVCKLYPCDLSESPDPIVDRRDFVVSFERIKALGFDCIYSLEDGIKDLGKWYRLRAESKPSGYYSSN
jgi:nucleoside-diphosphate-sugar epimerase